MPAKLNKQLYISVQDKLRQDNIQAEDKLICETRAHMEAKIKQQLLKESSIKTSCDTLKHIEKDIENIFNKLSVKRSNYIKTKRNLEKYKHELNIAIKQFNYNNEIYKAMETELDYIEMEHAEKILNFNIILDKLTKKPISTITDSEKETLIIEQHINSYNHLILFCSSNALDSTKTFTSSYKDQLDREQYNINKLTVKVNHIEIEIESIKIDIEHTEKEYNKALSVLHNKIYL